MSPDDAERPPGPARPPTAEASARARASDILRFNLTDHAFLRRRWHNFAEVAPGVYRSNHPNDVRFARYFGMGIRTVLNLRGESDAPGYRFEQAACNRLGLTLVSAKLYARAAPGRTNLARLFDLFRTIERPFLMHCKSGADRAGLASALYLLAHEGASVEQARQQLSIRFLHIRSSRTGILDYFLDLYEERLKQGPIPIEEWVATEYDQKAVDAAFKRLRGRA